MADNTNSQDPVQHGIDDNPSGDAEKGAALGGLGGAAVGTAAGALAGPVGMVVGAVVGGLTGAGASGLAVAAVDRIDNDDTVSGLGGSSAEHGGVSAMGTSGSDLPGASLAERGLKGGGPVSAPLPGVPVGGAITSGENIMATNSSNEMAAGGAADAYGTHQGRQITRAEYEQLNEADRMRVQLIAETLHVAKDVRQTGEVEVSKHVVQEQVQVPVTLQHEEVVVTRRAVNQPVDATTAGTVFQDETIRVPVHEEVAVVTKEAHVAEEIEIEKRAVAQQQTVTDTVRHEELDVHGNPEGRIRTENTTGTTGTSGTGGTGAI